MAAPQAVSREISPQVRLEVVLFAADLAAGAVSFGLALALRFTGDIPVAHLFPSLAFLPVLILLRVFLAAVFGLYDLRHNVSPSDLSFNGVGAALCGVGCGYLFLAFVRLYLIQSTELSRIAALLDFAILATWYALSRTAALAYLHRKGYRVRIALVGRKTDSEVLTEEIRKYAPRLIEVAGIVTPASDLGDSSGALGTTDNLHALLASEAIDDVILVQADWPQETLGDILTACDRSGVEVFLYPDLTLSTLANSQVMSLAGLPLVALTPATGPFPFRLAKRGIDLAAACLGLLLAMPIAAVVAPLIKLSSRGPVLYSQERVGTHKKPFNIHKFRTMVVDAEAESGPILSEQDDPRVTGIGRILRRFRIDEIPQLWNVLLGEMSLVGPRPERGEFVEKFIAENPLYERRFQVKPGLTGLAQIHGRYDTDYAHKLRYDLIYLNGMSPATDLRILLATVRTVLTTKGAR